MALLFERFSRFLFCQKTSIISINRCNSSCRVLDVLKLKYKPQDSVKVKGWIKASRKMKDLIFLDVSDGSCAGRLQVVVPKHLKVDGLSFGSSVEASGKISINSRNQQIELLADTVTLVGSCDPSNGFPFAARKSYPEEYVRQFLHFRPRHSTFASTLRVRDAAFRALHDVLGSLGFLSVNTPILTSNDCEGAGEVFLVTPNSSSLIKAMAKEGLSPQEAYFNCKAYLTVSGQLHLEAAARGLSNVYTFGPVFRAENSRSRLHLSEFYMLEAEVAFCEELSDIVELSENLVRQAAARILEKCPEDLTNLSKSLNIPLEERIQRVCNGPAFPRVPYSEAVSILQQHAAQLEVPPPQHGEALSKEHELFLCEHLGDQRGQALVFVTHWPTDIKPFYMKHCPDTSNVVLAFDLLGPLSGEICGGSVREPSVEVLENRIQQLDEGATLLKGLQWYMDIRRHGNAPTAGFGLGFERFLQCLLGIGNIKDTLPFPRWPHSLRM